MKQLAGSYVLSRTVTCNAAEDVKCGIYLNLSKNTIKFKCSSVLFSSFINAIGLSSSFLFVKLSGLDFWSSHWYCGINSRKNRGQLVGMILVKRADELPKVLDC